MSDSVPTVDEIDRELAFWEGQVARVKTNLDLLEQTPSYAFISGGLKLTGRTQNEIVEPILAARELADQYEMLAGHVAKARLLRNSLGRFRQSSKTLFEIDELLNKPCVPLPARQVSLAQRNLLDDPAAQSQLSLRQLVEIMTPAFASARDAVTRYDQVMASLTPALKAADQRLEMLAKRAAALGPRAVAAVEQVRSIVADARRQALDDPLSAQLSFDQKLRDLSQRLDAMQQERAATRDELVRAQARQTRAERTRGLDPSRVADLGDWLTNIAATLDAGQYDAARIGLQRWNSTADTAYREEEQRQEQLGLLKALRAMAQRRRERGALVDPDLDALALEAESALRQRPADLARAAQLVERYQRGVTAL